MVALCLMALVAACGRQESPRPASDSVPPPIAVDSTPSASISDLIHVAQPLPDALVSSPLTISGEARGNWYFEASFPVILIDAGGDTLAVKPAQAQGEWMTTNFVLFSITLDFTTPATPGGTLILKKDNPSGLPEHDAEVRIPVRFKP